MLRYKKIKLTLSYLPYIFIIFFIISKKNYNEKVVYIKTLCLNEKLQVPSVASF